MKTKLLATFVCGLAIVCGAALGVRHWRPPKLTQRERASPIPRGHAALIRTKPLHLPLIQPSIFVSKSQRELRLYSGGRIARVYRVGLGANPIDDKEREGDKRTPQGNFYITTKNAHSQFYRSLGISYPNIAAAKRGLQGHLITQAQYNQIMEANRGRRNPPQDTPLGGKVLIHGGGSAYDWTFGCVALDRLDILELFSAVPLGTPVRIEP
jgi:hypothetical protein